MMNKYIKKSLCLIPLCIGLYAGHWVDRAYFTQKELTGYCTINSEEDQFINILGKIDVYEKRVKRIREKVPNHPDYLHNAMLMANVHGYFRANYDVYRAITDLYKLNGLEINERSRELAMFYLKRGAKLGDKRAQKELENIYKSTVK